MSATVAPTAASAPPASSSFTHHPSALSASQSTDRLPQTNNLASSSAVPIVLPSPTRVALLLILCRRSLTSALLAPIPPSPSSPLPPQPVVSQLTLRWLRRFSAPQR
ncbi:hypothetical protein LINGRAHAP2_LOCUS6966 [Linum grandiflorum]